MSGTGDTVDSAIVITADDTSSGVAAEYGYLEELYGERRVDWTLESQSLLQVDGRAYDLLKITLTDGTQKSVYFDISSFYGRH